MLKKNKTLIATLSFCLAFNFTQTSQVLAVSVIELLGLENKQTGSTEDKKAVLTDKKPSVKTKEKSDWSKPIGSNESMSQQIDLDYVSLLVANMNEQERLKILEDSSLFKQVIENEANNLSAVSAAITNKVEQDRNVEFLMRRGAENILREAYLNRLVVSKLPKDFPSDEQINEYFESNKEQFIIPERIHVWQIFFKKSDAKEVSVLKNKAEKIISDIKKGKIDFSNVAISQSEHDQSKALGGYMGLLKTNELLPEMKEPILNLKEGELSRPLESGAGIHILKRGKIVKAESLGVAQVKPQISQLLVKQANFQLRQAIFAQARKEYPQNISDQKIEEWRMRLNTDAH
jgi:peptidylprolyl isomerase